MVRVHYDEGAAIHIGPESCAGGREAVREALTGECAGQPLSREKVDIPGADSVIVAVKSPNKTGEPGAEAMERRAGAEENASQQRTSRTQSRESVSQTLERVR